MEKPAERTKEGITWNIYFYLDKNIMLKTEIVFLNSKINIVNWIYISWNKI
jgi:hypothetical protein